MSYPGIGELRQRLALEAPLATPDGGGGETAVVWQLVAEVWAALRPLAGGETAEADGLAGRVTHEIWLRHRAGLALDMRFRLGTRVFDIKSIIDAGERQRFLLCLAEERLP